jgi:hypothetical protein
MHILLLLAEIGLAFQWNNTGKELHSKHIQRLNILQLPCKWEYTGKIYSSKCTGVRVSADKRSLRQGL